MTDAQVVFDPETYVTGVPFHALTRLRREAAITWVDESPVLGWPGGPGFWLVLRHADVAAVLKQSARTSAWALTSPAQMRALFSEVLARTSSLTYAGPPSFLRSTSSAASSRSP